jgi:hypothetical protein
VRSLVFVVVLVWVACSCGPSYQAVNECDARFEHCYALDLTAGASPGNRRTCWREWLRGYTYGQSRDRVEYAATRLSQLSLESTVPREGLPNSRSSADAASNAPLPIPTNAFFPPPNVAEIATPTASSVAEKSPAASASRAPGSECTDACVSQWRVCRDPCAGTTCSACDGKYRACASACFREEARSGKPVPSAIR